ncbi:hypothetical protein BD413DRAFT_308249 [Trametes elegans]|nr:hypothetical protein BD413DRAFT_308249 [Trametes elegans]
MPDGLQRSSGSYKNEWHATVRGNLAVVNLRSQDARGPHCPVSASRAAVCLAVRLFQYIGLLAPDNRGQQPSGHPTDVRVVSPEWSTRNWSDCLANVQNTETKRCRDSHGVSEKASSLAITSVSRSCKSLGGCTCARTRRARRAAALSISLDVQACAHNSSRVDHGVHSRQVSPTTARLQRTPSALGRSR